MTDIVVGVDAGGSKTHVLVATAAGETLASVFGPGAKMAPGNAEHCAAVIAEVVACALAEVPKRDETGPEGGDDAEAAGQAPVAETEPAAPRPRVLYVGAAGAGREAERIALQQELEGLSLADDVVVETDVEVALADAFEDGAGIVLVAGTGSIAYGRSPAGTIARCGGWGFAIGDEGSGAWIGRRALGVVASAHDGREPETALTGAVLTAAQVNEVEQLIPWAIAAGAADFATLAPVVFATAMNGDLRASAIVDVAVEELMLHVRALARRLFVDERAAFGVALTGGLLAKGSLVRRRLEKRLKHAVPGAELHGEEVIGARGAVKLAVRATVVR